MNTSTIIFIFIVGLGSIFLITWLIKKLYKKIQENKPKRTGKYRIVKIKNGASHVYYRIEEQLSDESWDMYYDENTPTYFDSEEDAREALEDIKLSDNPIVEVIYEDK